MVNSCGVTAPKRQLQAIISSAAAEGGPYCRAIPFKAVQQVVDNLQHTATLQS